MRAQINENTIEIQVRRSSSVMFLDCCTQKRTYEKFFGLVAARFCAINKMYVTLLEQNFNNSYDKIYRLDTNKLRNVLKFFAHLLFMDSISWEV